MGVNGGIGNWRLAAMRGLIATCLLPLCLLLAAAPSDAQDAAPPHWSGQQVERLIYWLIRAHEDAIQISGQEVPALRTAQLGRDPALLDKAATAAALRLLDAHRTGCCDAALRSGWLIPGDMPADGAARLREALAQEGIDRLFGDAAPRHPHYLALRRAYQEESDPTKKAVLAANMDRWRWMPRDLGQRYLLVNAAAFEAGLWQDGALEGRWAVIVGKTRSPTPVFAARVDGVILNPWWEIPASIAAEGIAAMVRSNPAAAAKRGYVYENGRYRQRPGPNNALGQMKLVMPNPHAVYLHDTPAKSLFGQDVRAYSHGCVRVGDALGLATALLAPQGWDRARVDRAVAGGATQKVTLDQPIPVYVAYFTAEPDDTGAIRYFPDIYKRDRAAVSPASGQPCGL